MKNQRLSALPVGIAIMVLIVYSFLGATAASATTYATYHTTTDVSARSTPTAAATGVYGAPAGSAIAVQCQVLGEPAGPYGNTLYFWVLYAGRYFYVPDTFTDSPHLAGQGPIAGIAMCDNSASSAGTPAIWVGSPVPGTWGQPGVWDTTPGGGHHRLAKASPTNDWAGDLDASAGTAAYLYVAPSDSAYNNNVTTRVTQIIGDNVCANGGGGDMVTVGIYFNGALTGRATYAHLDRNPSLAVGMTVSRWGTWLGNVANLYGAGSGGSNCWTGPHVHTELRAETNYACWNGGYSYAGYPVSRSNFIGFVSGPLTSVARACP